MIFGLLLIMAIFYVPYTDKLSGSIGWTWIETFIYDKMVSYEMNADLLIVELLMILFVGGFAYILFCVMLRKNKKRKRVRKENMAVISVWFLLVIVVTVLLSAIKAQLKIYNILHAIAIITLLFITLTYVIQTHKLLKQGKMAAEEEKKKRNADFAEKKLKEFYFPFRIKISQLEILMKKSNLSIDSVVNLTKDIVELVSKYGYNMEKEVDKTLLEMLEVIIKIKDFEEEIAEWKDEAMTKILELSRITNVEIASIKARINQVYKFKIQ